MGTFYPDDDGPFDPETDCPPYWRNLDNRITINHVNFTSAEYMDNIQVSAYIGMAINILIVAIWFISFKNKFVQIDGCCESFKFGGKLLIKFLDEVFLGQNRDVFQFVPEFGTFWEVC